MDNTQTIRFNWDKATNTGTSTVIINLNVLTKYAKPQLLSTYNQEHSIGSVIQTYDNLRLYEGSKKEVDGYIELLDLHKLNDESKFHGSHILYLLIEYMSELNLIEDQQEVRRVLNNRLYLLKHLTSFDNYQGCNIDIYDEARGTFKFHFGSEPILKRNVLNYLTGVIKSDLKKHHKPLYNLFMNGASETELEEAVKRQSAYEINKALVAKLAKQLVRFLNNETTIMRNPKQVDELSVSNAQGDFIFDILKHFQIYTPRQSANSTTVKHHDAIRKLIKRAAIFDEDKEDLI